MVRRLSIAVLLAASLLTVPTAAASADVGEARACASGITVEVLGHDCVTGYGHFDNVFSCAHDFEQVVVDGRIDIRNATDALSFDQRSAWVWQHDQLAGQKTNTTFEKWILGEGGYKQAFTFKTGLRWISAASFWARSYAMTMQAAPVVRHWLQKTRVRCVAAPQ